MKLSKYLTCCWDSVAVKSCHARNIQKHSASSLREGEEVKPIRVANVERQIE